SLAAGGFYSAITVLINVAIDAPAIVTNSVTMTGGGSASSTANDQTIVTAPSNAVADLVIRSFTAPSMAVAGGKLDNVSATVANQGSGAAGLFFIGVYLGKTPNVSASDIYTGAACAFS